MIRSSQVSVKFANTGRKDQAARFVEEYLKVTRQFVDILWEKRTEKIPSLVPKEITGQAETWLSARAIQCSAKQASGIVRGTIKKQKDRLYIIGKLNSEGRFKQARKLQMVYDKYDASKPNLKNVSPELDSRFVETSLESDTSFDGWLTISQLGNREKICIPFKKTTHFNKMLKCGTIKQGIRLSKKSLTFNFEIPDVEERTKGSVLGIDIGISDVLFCSNGYHSSKDCHGHTLSTIQQKLARRHRGSVGFRKAQSHRRNYINSCVNKIDISCIRQVNIEDIKNINFGKNSGRFLSHFVAAQILDKVEDLCVRHGVRVERRNQTYTSQRCSVCGWVRKSNREGKRFRCASCGFACDADLNAAVNLTFCLPATSKAERLSRKNLKGFFWLPLGHPNGSISQEPIVPGTIKLENSYSS